jgi:hypothetical protein
MTSVIDSYVQEQPTSWLSNKASGGWIDTESMFHQRFWNRDVLRSPSERLEPLIKTIELSRGRILGLRDNWDDKGSIGYQEETWKRAAQFVLNSAKLLWDCHVTVIDIPSLLPGPDGSIDIHWETKQYELAINIPTDPKDMATFYGDDKGALSIKGTLDPSSENQGLLLWLKNFIK